MPKPFLTIFLPVRNPGPELLASVHSLLAQTNRDFAVLLCDNHSTRGPEVLAQARELLQAAGLSYEIVRPPLELGRVEHWNFAALYPTTLWVKPLFVGDELLPGFVEIFHRRVAEFPAAGLFRCAFVASENGQERVAYGHSGAAGFLSPERFLDYYPHLGNWLGEPANTAFRQESLVAVGGFDATLPAMANYKAAALCALDAGVIVEEACLAKVVLQKKRCSQGICRKQVNGAGELALILQQVAIFARGRNLPVQPQNFRRAWLLQCQIDYWQPLKLKIKRLLVCRR